VIFRPAACCLDGYLALWCHEDHCVRLPFAHSEANRDEVTILNSPVRHLWRHEISGFVVMPSADHRHSFPRKDTLYETLLLHSDREVIRRDTHRFR